MRALASLAFIGFLIAVLILHIMLSRKSNKWLGLIIPLLNFICSIFLLLGIPSYMIITKQEVKTATEQGIFVNEYINTTTNTHSMDLKTAIFVSVVVFVIYNISTIILLLIYAACRPKHGKIKELEKMNIQDLE